MPSPHAENRRAPARVIRVEGAGGAAAPRALAASILAQLGAPAFDEPEGVVRAYYRIADETVRRRVFDLAKALANASDGLV